MLATWKKNCDNPRQHIQKQRHYFANKGPSSQRYGFSSGHVWMWELGCEESWVPKNWCFWTVVLEKTLESPARRSNQSILKEISPVCSLEGLMLKLKLQYFGHMIWRTDLFEKPWCWERLKAGAEGDDREWDGWMALLTQWTWFGWTPGVGDGQGGLVSCSSWGRKGSDTSEWLNWTESLLATSTTKATSISQLDYGRILKQYTKKKKNFKILKCSVINEKSVCLQCKRPGFNPWIGKIPWRRKWQPTPVLLPGKFHGQRSLVSYSPWGRKESDTTEPDTSLQMRKSTGLC